MRPSKLRRLTAHLAKTGRTYTSPRPTQSVPVADFLDSALSDGFPLAWSGPFDRPDGVTEYHLCAGEHQIGGLCILAGSRERWAFRSSDGATRPALSTSEATLWLVPNPSSTQLAALDAA